jgi:hypothetical protein
MARRTGVPSILLIAERMCILIVRYSGTIRRVYPDATALHAALDAAMAACGVLSSELESVREYGD